MGEWISGQVTAPLLETPRTSPVLLPHPFLPPLSEGVWTGGLGDGGGLEPRLGGLQGAREEGGQGQALGVAISLRSALSLPLHLRTKPSLSQAEPSSRG